MAPTPASTPASRARSATTTKGLQHATPTLLRKEYSWGGSTTHEQFGFSCAEAWMIRDGKLAEALRGTNLSGNLFRTLENIDMIGRDFEWTESGGNCGKGGQSAPVGSGSPYIRIQNAVVGGR